jgi:hypothetical protein
MKSKKPIDQRLQSKDWKNDYKSQAIKVLELAKQQEKEKLKISL